MQRRKRVLRIVRNWDDWEGIDEGKGITAFEIIEQEPDDGFTGLLDADGEPIFREKMPFGFVGKGAE